MDLNIRNWFYSAKTVEIFIRLYHDNYVMLLRGIEPENSCWMNPRSYTVTLNKTPCWFNIPGEVYTGTLLTEYTPDSVLFHTSTCAEWMQGHIVWPWDHRWCRMVDTRIEWVRRRFVIWGPGVRIWAATRNAAGDCTWVWSEGIRVSLLLYYYSRD
jgi:hypothetical protein